PRTRHPAATNGHRAPKHVHTYPDLLLFTRQRARTGATLAEVDAAAALQHRTDRKYLLPLDRARFFADQLADSHRVLDLAGRRTTSYLSTYFDTPQLGAWRAHVQRRRHRWKVRTRLYAEDGLCRAEVNTKDGRLGPQRQQ
ncbi:VTC domain-containing protein, partial [Streptomyces sp. NPDC005151]